MVTVLAGRPKVGKSMLTARWAAELSHVGERTVLVSAEDAPEANTDDVFYCPAFSLGNGSSAWLIDQIQEFRPRLIVLDPFTAMMSEASSSWSDQHVRRIIAPLADIANTLDVALVYVLHLRKGSASDPLEAIGGSVGLGAAPRSVLFFGRDPDGDKPNGRLLAHVACNVDEEGPTRSYELERILLPSVDRKPDVNTARLKFTGLSDETAEGMLRIPESNEERSDFDNAKILLRDCLWAGETATREVEAMLRANGISKSTEERARRSLGVEAVKKGTGWYLKMPNSVTKEDRQAFDGLG
jgi:putative DNA primase/helicase